MRPKSLLFIGILLISDIQLFCQSPMQEISQNFTSFQNPIYQEKVFLHTDKSVYVTGEILWFKAYITSANDHKPSSLSHICYVEIIDRKNKAIIQGKIAIDAGTGDGSFILPASIRTGNYQIRAYTRWMKNFPPEMYFQKVISVINPGKKMLDSAGESTQRYHLAFFPAGGRLINGLESKVAFRLMDNNGKGTEGSGIVINDKKDTLTTFNTDGTGRGFFRLKPITGFTYQAIIKIQDTTVKAILPEVFEEGIILSLNKREDSIIIHILGNEDQMNPYYVVAQSNGTIPFVKEFYLRNGNFLTRIPSENINEGVTKFTVFNHLRQPVSERLYYQPPTNPLQFTIGKVAENYSLRKPVEVELNSQDTSLGNADLSVSVFLVDSLQSVPEDDISSFLWLQSDIGGPATAENINVSLQDLNDLTLLTSEWRRFNWSAILNKDQLEFGYLPEREGHLVKGRISPTVPGIKSIKASAAVPGKNFTIAQSASDTDGEIQFNIEPFYGRHEIIFQTAAKDSSYSVLAENPFSDRFLTTFYSYLQLDSQQSNAIAIRDIGVQLPTLSMGKTSDQFSLPANFDTTIFFGTPSKTYFLDDYTRFKTMEEVMREYVTEVRVRNQQQLYTYKIYNENTKLFFEGDPLVLMDGVPVNNISKIINTDPLKVKKIDIVSRRFFLGNNTYDGIVSYTTYDEDPDVLNLDPNAVVMEYEGLQFPREFYSASDLATDSLRRIPDYRNVLYWSPTVNNDNGKRTISFFTSDIPGRYVIIVQGITPAGKAGVAMKQFTVTDQE